MTKRPMIFSGPMVRALIEGRKTQTRRVLSKTWTFGSAPRAFWEHADFECAWADPGLGSGGYLHVPCHMNENCDGGRVGVECAHCAELGWDTTSHRIYPPWRIGDRLWVREAWRTFVSLDKIKPRDIWPRDGKGAGVAFEAGGGSSINFKCERYADYSLEPRHDIAAFGRLRAAMHMPRWASRLTLTVTEVRVQRLQDISEADARAEGVEPQIAPSIAAGFADAFRLTHMPHKSAYANLWNTLHGPGAWEVNPWVAALTFTVERRNIDAPAALPKP